MAGTEGSPLWYFSFNIIEILVGNPLPTPRQIKLILAFLWFPFKLVNNSLISPPELWPPSEMKMIVNSSFYDFCSKI